MNLVVRLNWLRLSVQELLEINMLDILLYVALGAFIGWNLPQPAYAKFIQSYVMSLIKKSA